MSKSQTCTDHCIDFQIIQKLKQDVIILYVFSQNGF